MKSIYLMNVFLGLYLNKIKIRKPIQVKGLKHWFFFRGSPIIFLCFIISIQLQNNFS